MKVLKTQQATAVAFSTFHKQRVASIKEDLFAISSDWWKLDLFSKSFSSKPINPHKAKKKELDYQNSQHK